MANFFTSKAMKALAVSSLALVAGNAMAQDAERKLYLCDVYTEAQLTSDIFGVPMRIDQVEDGKYVARYFNEKANNEIYFSANKTDFTDVYGVDEDGNWSSGAKLDDVKPIILPEANKYYQIDIDENEGTVAVKTYEVADYMDPVFMDLMSTDTWNVWAAYVEPITDAWTPKEEAWKREFYFGYTCTEYLVNDNNEYVDSVGNVVMYDKEAGIDERVMAKKPLHINGEDGTPQIVKAEQLRWCELWHQNPNNPHQYIWDKAKHFVAGQKLNFIIHNWHEAGWWNDVTWRVDNEEECEIFYYYGRMVKQAYLDYAFGAGKADFAKWIAGEDHRKELIYGPEGSDSWCKPTVNKTDDYVLVFDSHLGRGKLVPKSEINAGIGDAVVGEEMTEGPVEYYNLNGMRVNGDNLATGIYIKRQGSKASKIFVK